MLRLRLGLRLELGLELGLEFRVRVRFRVKCEKRSQNGLVYISFCVTRKKSDNLGHDSIDQ